MNEILVFIIIIALVIATLGFTLWKGDGVFFGLGGGEESPMSDDVDGTMGGA